MISLVIYLAILGFLVWLLITYVPMPQPIKTAIIVVVVVMIILYLLRALGFADLPMERIR